jgi:hypothetical protein
MSKIIRQGPSEPDPLEGLRDEVSSLRDELSTLQETIRTNHEWLKSAVREILQELESKSDRD